MDLDAAEASTFSRSQDADVDGAAPLGGAGAQGMAPLGGTTLLGAQEVAEARGLPVAADTRAAPYFRWAARGMALGEPRGAEMSWQRPRQALHSSVCVSAELS